MSVQLYVTNFNFCNRISVIGYPRNAPVNDVRSITFPYHFKIHEKQNDFFRPNEAPKSLFESRNLFLLRLISNWVLRQKNSESNSKIDSNTMHTSMQYNNS